MVLRFTLQLEDQTRQFYEKASLNEKNAQAKELFAKFAENSKRRKQELEKAAREGVDHSLLEPVSGIFEESYTGTPTYSETMDLAGALAAASQLEELMQKFYNEASEKIRFISGVARLFKRCSQDRAKALASLRLFS